MLNKSLIFCLVIFITSCVWAGGRADRYAWMSSMVAQLRSDVRLERQVAAGNLIELREDYVRQLVEQLSQASKNKRGAFHDSFHECVRVVGPARMIEAVPILLDNIDYELDVKLGPVGGRFSRNQLVPCANALVEISCAKSTQDVLKKVKSSENDRSLRIRTWVLCGIIGGEAGLELIRSEIKVNEGHAKENLENAADLIIRSLGKHPYWSILP